MKNGIKALLLSATVALSSCSLDEILDHLPNNDSEEKQVNFEYKKTISIGGEGAAEISAYDPTVKLLYVTNSEKNQVEIFDISDINAPKAKGAISGDGAPNSVTAHNGKVAIAFENANKQENGTVFIYEGNTGAYVNAFTVGALPDMLTFSKNGKYIVVANEGEPNKDYTTDPNGSVSIIDVTKGAVTTLDFTAFNSMEDSLEANGFRVFGPGADLAADVEPEYVAISDDSKTAWVSLQENNGIAKIDLQSKMITNIYPLGTKDYSLAMNSIDASDKDDKKELKTWPVKSFYQPDAITYVKINGRDYIISANEGDARDYDGYSEEKRLGKVTLDPTAFPNAADLQEKENLGRLKITTANGDTDGDGDIDEIYGYGARSFSIWNGYGDLVYDSGNSISKETLARTPSRFNDNDKRSDDKGAEPEAVDVLKIGKKHILFVGLERNDQVLVYDISNPTQPTFLSVLSHAGDEAPEGVLAIAAKDSPTGKDLLVVSNEDSGTVTFYENK